MKGHLHLHRETFALPRVERFGKGIEEVFRWMKMPATGTGERDTAKSLIAGLPPRRVTIGGDKGYETRDFVKTFRT